MQTTKETPPKGGRRYLLENLPVRYGSQVVARTEAHHRCTGLSN